jgi:carbon storage regulator
MLVLSRKLNESIVIDDNIVVTVLSVKGGAVKLGITAPNNVRILRTELMDQTEPPRLPKNGSGSSRVLYAMSEL